MLFARARGRRQRFERKRESPLQLSGLDEEAARA